MSQQVHAPTQTQAPSPPTFAQALLFWFKLGCISFGGPAGQIAIMHQELVERRRWISQQRFLHALNYCMVLPGPEAQQLATYIGWLLHGTRGGLAAGLLFVLPAMLLLMVLSGIYLRYGQTEVLAGILAGLKPAVVALVFFAAFRLAEKTLKKTWLWAIAIGAFLSQVFLKLPFPAILVAAAALGWLAYRLKPNWFIQAAQVNQTNTSQGPAVIDDASATPAHAHYTFAKLVRVVLIGLVIGVLAYLLARAAHPELARMAQFFTQVALVTFGGAYAVLPYVVQGSVQEYQWLTTAQMMDGLALGESTPGPLIIIVTFVGFLGGVAKEIFGPDQFWLAGLAGGLVVTFFTFLPSFIFIFAGGPFIESTRQSLKLTGPLTAMTAAIVGVIASLGLFFAQHTINTIQSALLAVAALIALAYFKVGTIKVLASCAAIGLLARLALP